MRVAVYQYAHYYRPPTGGIYIAAQPRLFSRRVNGVFLMYTHSYGSSIISRVRAL